MFIFLTKKQYLCILVILKKSIVKLLHNSKIISISIKTVIKKYVLDI